MGVGVGWGGGVVEGAREGGGGGCGGEWGGGEERETRVTSVAISNGVLFFPFFFLSF